jgi:SAM-dependent methyltransferase
MTTASEAPPAPTLASHLINGLLSIGPVWDVAKRQARHMMIKRAERLGVPWQATVNALSSRDWARDWHAVLDETVVVPANYRAAFHGYDEGHFCWQAAFEFEVASNAVHSRLFPEAGKHADTALRRGYHDVLGKRLATAPDEILDLHCTVGLSSFALQALYPEAQVTGVDFSPFYLAVARHHARPREAGLRLIHALPEATGLPDRSFGLVSAFLLFHEMPSDTTRRIFREARRLVAPGGCFAFMDMDPEAHAYANMPPYLMTLLKSTEPYLDEYFALSMDEELRAAGFDEVSIEPCSPRHRAVLARVRS